MPRSAAAAMKRMDQALVRIMEVASPLSVTDESTYF
jgi:hypothetical protein